jgi:hypothetical protein
MQFKNTHAPKHNRAYRERGEKKANIVNSTRKKRKKENTNIKFYVQ